MGETKAKSSARRPKKDANSPVPSGVGGSMCGHSACNTVCRVRYAGPTTHMRDHHIVHAARGVAHVWSAAIVAGLAVVLTGAIAYTAVDASTTSDVSNATLLNELQDLNLRIDRLEGTIKGMNDLCTVESRACTPVVEGEEDGASTRFGQ